MDLSLNETQRMLQSVARDFAQRELSPRTVRQTDESASGFSAGLWKQMADLGWPGMVAPEAWGGTANSLTDMAMVMEALGEAACPSPLLSSVLCAQAVLAAGDHNKAAALLPPIAAGGRIPALVLTGRDYGWDAASVGVQAASGDGGFTLHGIARFVPYAHAADDLLVVARTASNGSPEQGITLFHVEATRPNIAVRRQSGWLGEPVCEVAFDGVEVPGSAVVGEPDHAWPGLENALDRAAVLLCAFMLGGAQRATDMAIEYSKTRVAFGVPIGTFQRVQDLVIGALNATDMVRWTTYEALWKLDTGRPGAGLAASLAKAVASEQFMAACERSHYVHAGVGMDLDFGLTNLTRRAKFYSHYLGDATHHKLRMARLLEL